MPFSFILTDTGTTTDNLLKLRHRLDFLVYNNQSAGLAVNTGRQHLRGGNNARIWLVHIDEVIQLLFALIVITSNLHYISGILLAKIRIEVCKQLAHRLGFLDVRTEDNRLCHPSNLTKHLSNTAGHNLTTLH